MRPIQKRFTVTAVFAFSIIAMYQLIDINLFTIDLPRRTRSALFRDFKDDVVPTHEILIADIGYLPLEKVIEGLEHLQSLHPKVIGVNLCNIKERNAKLDSFLQRSPGIITCDCKPNSVDGSSKIVNSHNEVTHFAAGKDSYFEMRLSEKRRTDLSQRADEEELINFWPSHAYYQMRLSELDSVPIDLIEGKTVIVGFLRDSLITPMNRWYGASTDIPGDMSDAQISANIISTIDLQEFITEVGPVLRITVIIFVSLVCAGLILILKTKQIALNLLIALTIQIVLNIVSSFAIVFLFKQGYYLKLDEITLVLIVTAIVSVYWNSLDNKSFWIYKKPKNADAEL